MPRRIPLASFARFDRFSRIIQETERLNLDRRAMVKLLGGGMILSAGGPIFASCSESKDQPMQKSQTKSSGLKKPLFEISLAEWSLHRALYAAEITNLEFPAQAKKIYGINGCEFVNSFFKDKAKDRDYLNELKQRADDLGVRCLLIMCDGEGALGDADERRRMKAVENHHRWVEAAKFLGCHSIRVNAQSSGTFEEQQDRSADGLRKLAEFAKPFGLNVIVENHGGLSSNGSWLAGVMKEVNLPNCGTLPDFGNFNLGGGKSYDRYRGVSEMMPYAKAVSAKSYAFDEIGNETTIDYHRMMKIVIDTGYHEFLGVEYEGDQLSEHDGILATKKLLERVRARLSA